MTSDAPQIDRTDEGYVTIPVGWRIVDLNRLLDPSFAHSIVEALGESLDAEEAATVSVDFRELHERVEHERILLMAVRVRADGTEYDTLTVALPADPVRDAEFENGAAERAGPAPQAAEPVMLLHSTQSGAPAGTASWPARVQVVVNPDDSRHSAVVTILSSKAGVEPDLEDDARAIGRSLQFKQTNPAERAPR
jgi:hypothetical protein